MNRGQKTLQEYKSINDLLPLHFIIQIFQKSFMSFANHKQIIKSKYPSINLKSFIIWPIYI